MFRIKKEPSHLNNFILLTSNVNREEKLSSFSDEQLVSLCKAGKKHYWRLLYDRHNSYVANIAWKMLGDREIVVDVIQEAFLRAIRGIKNFKGDSSFKTWLTRITVNLCKDHYKYVKSRHGKSHISINDNKNEGIKEIPDTTAEADPECQLLRKELRSKVKDAVEKLSPEHKTVILLSLQEIPYSEIAKITGTSEKTVGSRIYYAKMELKKFLKH